MKDNCYAYAIDLSLRKGKDGQYSEPLIYECQPLLSSNLRGNSDWKVNNAFAKAFFGTGITIDIQGEKIRIPKKSKRHIFIKNSENISQKEYLNMLDQAQFTHVHTGSFETEIDKLNNKILQRLYLPDEVSPEYRILQSNTESEELTEEIFNYFSVRGVSKIVLKSAVSHEGLGNIFIHDIQDKEALKKDIEKIKSLNPYQSEFNIKYFIAEEQKEFPRISRKTGEEKPDHLTFRLVGIANQEGDIGHFIVSKSISASLNSHQQQQMTCYFGNSGETYSDEDDNWLLKACGPKDKYFGKGDNKVEIDPDLMAKISKQMYQLYVDIKSMTNEDFEKHIDQLVTIKNALASRQERIKQFILPTVVREEIVNKKDYYAFGRACEADYAPLAKSIASEMIAAKTANLNELTEYPNYRQADQLKIMLKVMEEKLYFKGLLTANKEQLKYCLETKVAPNLSRTLVKAIAAKKKKLAGEKQPVEDNLTPEKAGSSGYSALQPAFFSNKNSSGSITGTTNVSQETASTNFSYQLDR